MKRVKMINALGNDMWVAEDRVEEYKAAGHRLAADVFDEETTETVEAEEEKAETEEAAPEEAEELPEEPAEEPAKKGKRSGKAKAK